MRIETKTTANHATMPPKVVCVEKPNATTMMKKKGSTRTGNPNTRKFRPPVRRPYWGSIRAKGTPPVARATRGSAELGAVDADEAHHLAGIAAEVVCQGQLLVGGDLPLGLGDAPHLQPHLVHHAQP